MKKIKKTLAVLLSVLIVFTAMPMVVVNAEGEEPALELNIPVEVNIPASDGSSGDEMVNYQFSPVSDGWYRFYSTGDVDTVIYVYDSEWKLIDYSDDIGEDLNFDLTVQLHEGEVYYVQVDVWDIDDNTQFTFEVTEGTGIASVEITKGPENPNIIEGFEEQTMSYGGMEATITLVDGEEIFWSSGMIMAGGFFVDTEFASDEQGNFYVDIICGGVSDRFYYTVIENPVVSMEYICDTPIEYYEHSNGYFDDGQYIYDYNTPSDAVFKVNYKDGTYDEFSLDFKYTAPEYEDDQTDNPWTVGTDNYFTVSYLGAEVKVQVTILECPFVNVTVDKTPSKKYVFGDEKYGWSDDENTFYCFWPSDISDLHFTVEYKDGSKESFGPEQIDMYEDTIDGFEYRTSQLKVTQPGTYDATLSYKGYDINYEVEVIESLVKEMKVVADPTVTQYDNCYLPVFDGMQIEITYADNTTKVVTLSDENTKYVMQGDLRYEVTIDGQILTITRGYFESDNPYEYVLRYIDLEEFYDGFTFVDSDFVVDFAIDNFAADGDGMICTFTYEDGTQDEITLEKLAGDTNDNGYYEGYAMTKNGIAEYNIAEVVEDESVVGYDVYVAHNYVYYELPSETFMLGDVDDDGKITIMDATHIQRHLAKLETLEGDALLAADTYKDGQVSVLDASQIQRLVAKLITEF